MKKIGIIVSALAFLAVLTQCKKESQPTQEAVTITLDLKGNQGTRMDVNTVTGEVTYQNGDVIYVASSGHFIGTLTYNGTNFSGGITDPTVGQPLHFYFLGNVTPAETLSTGSTTSCSVVISDQTEHLPVIEYAPSTENYDSGSTTYTAMLLNKCALVKFNVTTTSEAATCITGMKNKVTIDFNENTITPSQEGNGIIKLQAGSGEKWVILLPQEATEAGEDGSAYSEDGVYTGTRGAVPAIAENGYLTAGIEVNVTTEGGTPSGHPEGTINGLFTINAEGDQIYFSQGNLQYQASTDTWRFAENQWNSVGADNSNISSTYDGWIDLFGWGTSGYHNVYDNFNVNYQPYSYSAATVQTECNYYGYGPSTNMYDPNLTGMSAEYDWGVLNAISNGGNQAGLWRTLTSEEWNYIFNTRSTSTIGNTSNARFAKAKVNGVSGVILFPDVFSLPIYLPTPLQINNRNASFGANSYSEAGWTALENLGCVFLPTTGYRSNHSGQTIYSSCIFVYDTNSVGNYWSTTSYNEQKAYYVNFSSGGLNSQCNQSNIYRYNGFSVRLVSPIE